MSFKLSATFLASQLFPCDAADYRAAVKKANSERVQTRQQELASQFSMSTSAHERIRIWERLHELRLPQTSDHKLVAVIAEQTNLTVEQVCEEQQRRAGVKPSSTRVHAAV